MARIQKRDLLSDIELRVNQGTISDDSELDRRQIAAWISEELNGLVAQDCKQALSRGNQVPPIYVARETSLALTEESVPEISDDDQRLYFDITGKVLDIEDDAGVVLVTDDELNEIYKATTVSLPGIRLMRYTAPNSQGLLVYSRQGSRFFVEGYQSADVYLNSIIVYYVAYQDVVAMADTDYIIISDLFLPVVKDRVTELAMKQMYGTTPDQNSDGKDDKQQVYHRAIQQNVDAGQG